MNWLDKFKRKGGPDITKPVPIPPLATPLPDNTAGKSTEKWRWYNSTPAGRRYLEKRRERPTVT